MGHFHSDAFLCFSIQVILHRSKVNSPTHNIGEFVLLSMDKKTIKVGYHLSNDKKYKNQGFISGIIGKLFHLLWFRGGWVAITVSSRLED